MWRNTFMSSPESPDILASHIPPDDPQLMLVVAYTRLFLMPERPDGSKCTIVASYGEHDIRLVMMPPTKFLQPLWIELYDKATGRCIDSMGCRDLDQTHIAAEALIDEALRRNGIGPHD